MDNAIFTNLPPKVGYLDDTKMQIYSAFNMSYNTVYNRAPWVCSDSDDRTNVFIECYTEPISKLPKTSTGDTYSDSSQFARVIVAEIETSAGYPIKQTIYPVGDGYLK